MTDARRTEILARGLSFGEGPRWHDGAFWLSDFHRRVVERMEVDGTRRVVAELDDMPSGLGWLPDGRLLVVAKKSRAIYRLEATGLTLHADLSHIATYWCNDMVVDRHGRAYVGNYGAELSLEAPPTPATLACVEPNGVARAVGTPLLFPNGSVVTPDGKTLLVAETLGSRISAFDIAPDGDLSRHRIWAPLESVPDGMCLDAEGAVWVALPAAGQVLRVVEGGAVIDRVQPTSDAPIACMLGGKDRRTLLVLTAPLAKSLDDLVGTFNARAEITTVDVPGAGCP
jgi:sugar lactone lactonase YvrE